MKAKDTKGYTGKTSKDGNLPTKGRIAWMCTTMGCGLVYMLDAGYGSPKYCRSCDGSRFVFINDVYSHDKEDYCVNLYREGLYAGRLSDALAIEFWDKECDKYKEKCKKQGWKVGEFNGDPDHIYNYIVSEKRLYYAQDLMKKLRGREDEIASFKMCIKTLAGNMEQSHLEAVCRSYINYEGYATTTDIQIAEILKNELEQRGLFK